MSGLYNFFQTFVHLDEHIHWLITHYGAWTYLIIFILLFAETGFVITPFLPGDTLLFAAGVFAASGSFNLYILIPIMIAGPLAGDITNFHIGKWLGPRLFNNEKSKLLNRKHLERTHQFFEVYGGKTIILARWVPIVRTFAPFVAGLGRLTFRKFISFSVIGALVWVNVCTFAGYFFGGLPWVKNNFELAMLGMILVTLVPVFVEAVRHRIKSRVKAKKAAAAESPEE